MSSDPNVYEQLLQMGIDEPIVKEASIRFQDIERAVNWAFDHGQTWLDDNNAASTGGFGTSTSDDLLGKGPPQQQTHNNSPNVSPVIGPQAAPSMEVEDLRAADTTGLNEPIVTKSFQPSTLPQNQAEESQEPFGQGDAHHHNKTYSKKSKTTFGVTATNVLGVQPKQTPATANRQLPPAPPLDQFDTQEFRIPGESEEDQIQRAIRMSLGQDDGPFTNVPLTHPPTQHIGNSPSATATPVEAMDTEPPSYSEPDSSRRLRASAPPPEFTVDDNNSGIQIGSNNPFKSAAAVSTEKSVTFSKVPDTTIDHGNSSLVPVGPGGDNPAARTLTAQEQEDADLQAALSASLSENQQGGFAATQSTSSVVGGPSAPMEGVEELDLDPEGKTLFDEGQQNVPLKQDEAPMAISVLWDNGLYAANIIQCLMATPQFQAAVASVDLPSSTEVTGNERLKALVDLARFFQSSSNAYVTTLLGMNTLFDVSLSNDVSRSAISFLQQVVDTWLLSDSCRAPGQSSASESPSKEFNPLFVSKTTLINSTESEMNAVASYTLNYSPSSGNSITDLIAAELWAESPNRFFASLGDVLPIVITRGAKNVWGETKPMVFDEELYMDRFMAENASQVAQIRGNEGLLKKKIENLQEELQKWTTHKTNDISATLDRTLKHFERKAEETSDQTIKDEVGAIIEKLKDARSSIATRKEELRRELEEEQQKSKDCWYQPGMNQDRYTLRGVCFYAGWIARTSMYCYVKGQSNAWWKISDTVVEPATFEQIKEDRTGLYFDSGAYLLVYARQALNPGLSETQEKPIQMETDTDQLPGSLPASSSEESASSLQITL